MMGHAVARTSIDADQYPLLAKLAKELTAPSREILGREHEIQQILAALCRPEVSNVMLTAEAGSGKLLPLGTLIPTPTGWTTMGDLQPGDTVLGRDGRPTTVTYVSPVDPHPKLYDITLSDGQIITACADHQWLVADIDGRRQMFPGSLQEVRLRRSRSAAHRQNLLDLRHDAIPQTVTARELVSLVSGVPGSRWRNPTSLQARLSGMGVPRQRVGVRQIQSWKGGTRWTTVYKDYFDTTAALTALASMPYRHCTWRSDGQPAESVMTTQQMVNAGVQVPGTGRKRFSIRVTEPLNLPEADLLVDPYVLGAWLGDGCTAGGRFTQCDDPADDSTGSDMDHLIAEISRAGYNAHRTGSYQTIGTSGLQVQLRTLGVLGDKHIPTSYLRASIGQRLALLQGLMDTDGTVSSTGQCELDLSNRALALNAVELIRSLGIKVAVHVHDAHYRDGDGAIMECQPRYRMVFITTQKVFRLPRKAARLRTRVRPTREWLYITGIAPAQSQPGKCIQVDNSEHMYLAGPGFVPTHNTALVQATMLADTGRLYLEVDPARMIAEAGDSEQMAAILKSFFDEAERWGHQQDRELVLFIDEFHQIVQLSDAAVEAIKPVLAASGSRGIRIIAATTYEEFHQHIAPNQPLVERLQRINLASPDEETTVAILAGMAEHYGVGDQFGSDQMFRLIYEYTERYVPASAQPRKSILVLDAMVGWNRLAGSRMDRRLLAQVLAESVGVDVAFGVDGAAIKKNLDATVFAQDLATSTVARRLQLAVADLNDPTRPMASLLFTGSTGVGKAVTCDTLIPVCDAEGAVAFRRAGDITSTDRLFNRSGQPVAVPGIFPQGRRPVYRVTLADGRHVDVSDNHLWAVRVAGEDPGVGHTVLSTSALMARGLRRDAGGRSVMRFAVPMNEAVAWPVRDLATHPYVMGVLVGCGRLRVGHAPALMLSGGCQPSVAQLVNELVGAAGAVVATAGHSWQFLQPDRGTAEVSGTTVATLDRMRTYVRAVDVCGAYPEVYNTYAADRRIPPVYLCASIEQRWELVRGLFDTDAQIRTDENGRVTLVYQAGPDGLADDICRLLRSLGLTVTCTVTDHLTRAGNQGRTHEIVVRASQVPLETFFRTRGRRAEARLAAQKGTWPHFDHVGIASIQPLDRSEEMVCFYVDDEEHLFQSGDFVVTHNTQLTKELARLLFGDDQRHLLRFDMTEFAEDTSLSMFRSELTRRVWDRPHSVLLFDEIEKASPLVIRVLMQVLDDARLLDDNRHEVSFLDTYIVLTTNAGSEIYQTIGDYESSDTGSGENMEAYDRLIRRSITQTTSANRFPVELLGRIDAIVPFQPLSRATLRRVVRSKLRDVVQAVLVKHDVHVQVDKRVLDYLVADHAETDSDAGGARAAVRRLTNDVTTELAAYINQHPTDKYLRIDVTGELVSEHKDLLHSDARIEVRPTSLGAPSMRID